MAYFIPRSLHLALGCTLTPFVHPPCHKSAAVRHAYLLHDPHRPMAVFFFNDPAPTKIYTLSLHDALPILISRAEGFKCVSHYGNAEAALVGLPKDNLEVVLMDINLPGMNGVECVRQLKQLAPKIQAVMLTVYEDTENIFNALAAGASGYLLKRTKTAELLEAIREVDRK